MTIDVSVDIHATRQYFSKAGINVKEAVHKIESTLAYRGEHVMKSISPVRTGTLRRSIHAYPTRNPFGIATSVNYAWMANVRSRSPRFIDRTETYIKQRAPVEAKHIIEDALK